MCSETRVPLLSCLLPLRPLEAVVPRQCLMGKGQKPQGWGSQSGPCGLFFCLGPRLRVAEAPAVQILGAPCIPHSSFLTVPPLPAVQLVPT